jgi:hypothetical protein
MKNLLDSRLAMMMFVAFSVTSLLLITIGGEAAAASGASFTTFNAHVDGASKDVCKNSAINCNIYGAKEYVWLNGGPTANGLLPDGQYFFAVLTPGGQPNPNDGGANNLSDNYDCYLNRVFTVTNGEVSAYSGYACGGAYPFQIKHWLDDGKSVLGSLPNGKVPYIRLFPFADTTNSGGVYVLAVCSLYNGYPVDPRDCKYDAFKVKKGKIKAEYSFMLSGIKFKDTNCNHIKNSSSDDPGLSKWTINIDVAGPEGDSDNAKAVTGEGGYWTWLSPTYIFTDTTQIEPVHLEVCEVLQSGWTQYYPATTCYTFDFTPIAPGFDSSGDLDFGNNNECQ